MSGEPLSCCVPAACKLDLTVTSWITSGVAKPSPFGFCRFGLIGRPVHDIANGREIGVQTVSDH